MKKMAKRHWNSDNLIILLASNVNVMSFCCLLHFEPAAADFFLLSLCTAQLFYRSNLPYLFLIETESDRHKQILL